MKDSLLKKSHCYFMYLSLIVISTLSFYSCNNRMDRTFEQAGDNVTELKKVLAHYEGDEQKHKAACYLIEHMYNCYSYNDRRIDSLKQLKWMSVKTGESLWLDSVKRVWSDFNYEHAGKIYDAKVITAKYLIENIDRAFNVWKT